jgi:glycosyltransferase involved in cell wall biosynthesis
LQQSEIKTERDSRSILWVASLDQHKRFELCVQVVEFLRKTAAIDLKLIVITRKGNDRTAMEKYQGENSKLFDWIEWNYEISDSKLIELYRTSKLLLVTSVAEGFCLPALEAMSQGLPVVHPNIEALVELCGEMDGDANNSEFQVLASNALHLIQDENYWHNQSLSSIIRSKEYEYEFFEEIILRELQSLLCK